MKKSEYPPYEDIYDMYITQNWSSKDIINYYHISRDTFFKIIKYYGIQKDQQLIAQVRKRTNQEKYGVDSVSQLREIRDKIENVCLQRYGTKNPMQSTQVRDKAKQTNIKRYGAEAPAQNTDVLNKMRDTCLRKYGVSNPSLVEEFKNKRKETNLQRFGVECNLSTEETKEQIKNTCSEKYGVPYACMRKECCGTSHGSYSRNNEAVAELLAKNGLVFDREFILNNYIYDFKINNILLEINPTYTHSIDICYHNKGEALSKNYHHDKTTNAIQNNFLCLHVFDWDDIDSIILRIKNNEYDNCLMQEGQINTFWVNLKNKQCIPYSIDDNVDEFLRNHFVRVCDDGYNIILDK